MNHPSTLFTVAGLLKPVARVEFVCVIRVVSRQCGDVAATEPSKEQRDTNELNTGPKECVSHDPGPLHLDVRIA